LEANIDYRSVKLDHGWRPSWDAIVAGKFADSPYDSLLFYDAAGGTGEFYSIDHSADLLGSLVLLGSHSDWSTNWSDIVPGSYDHSLFTGLVFYDRATGDVEIKSSDGQGNLTLLAAHPGWMPGWDAVIPIDDPRDSTRLLSYNRTAGEGAIYATDGSGGLVAQQSYTGWRTTWTHIIPAHIDGSPFVLFYEASSGHAELHAVDPSGNITFKVGFSGWRSSWSIIKSVDLRATGYAGLLFYDRTGAVAELYTLDAAGKFDLVKTLDGWRNSWASISTGSFGGVFGDLLLYDKDAGDGELRALDCWPMGPLEGYLSSESVRPREPFTVHVRSKVGPFRVELLRRGLTDTVILEVGICPDEPVDIPLDAPENGCAWPAATTMVVPTGSPSGLYIVRLSSLDHGVTGEVPFIVIAEAPGDRTDTLVAIPSATYEAYSWWGGRSLYGHGGFDGSLNWAAPMAFGVSPRRPYLGPDDLVTPKFQYWELPLIRWLEQNGITVDYCTSNELHSNPELLSHYRLVVTIGHDEYWSFEMRDHVEQFAENGGTVAILSGNTCWWQIRFDNPPAITCYKDANLDPASADPALHSRVTVEWIKPVLNRPETLMTGVSFGYGTLIVGQTIDDGVEGTPRAPVFEVVAEDAVLQGTNLHVGDTFGTYSSNVGRRPPYRDGRLTVIGYECDARPTPSAGSVLPDQTPPDWRSTWANVIPLDLSVGSSPYVLFYDRSLGEGEMHSLDPSGTINPLQFDQGWRQSWDRIVSGAFGPTQTGGLLFYDRAGGLGELYAVQANGGITLLQSHEGWRPSWDIIVAGNFTGREFTDVLLYDRTAGLGEFYSTDASGNISLLNSYDGWRQSWDIIVTGNFGGSGSSDILFYDRAAGQGEFHSVSGGAPAFFKGEPGWRSSWDIIVPLELGLGHTALLFYDRGGGTGEIYLSDDLEPIKLLASHTDWRTTWTQIVPLRLQAGDNTFLLFYESGTGDTELYSVDRAGGIGHVQSYGDPSFGVVARSIFPRAQTVQDRAPHSAEIVTREYASMGRLRKGSGNVLTVSTTDWSFGLSQNANEWSVIDQITANILHLYGSAPEISRPITEMAPIADVQPPSPELRRQWDQLGKRSEVPSRA
jgi:hypothetical protein